jgi:DUF4097 and DUF4098 domain-containing protein YvlB
MRALSESTSATQPSTRAPEHPSTFITRQYNPRVWILLAAALVVSTELTDRQTHTISLPAGKTLSIEVTIGSVRIEGADRSDAEIIVERHAPNAAQLARIPVAIDDTAARVVVRALQTENTTDPAIKADVTVRLPRLAAIDHVQVLEGRISIAAFSGRINADIRRGPIDGKELSGTVRLETGIGSVTLTAARLSANGLLRLRAFNGDVRLSLAERPADARILALALNGPIKSDIPLTTKDTWGPRWGEATLGKGEPVISIDVVTGSIVIKSP